MSIATAGTTRVIAKPFSKTVPLIRRMLSDAGLSVVDQFKVTQEPYFHFGDGGRSCLILLVDTPALLFECIALDRAAAVFLPIHVVISGDGGTSYIHCVNPMTSSGLRPPAPAKFPLQNLCARVAQALSGLPAADGTSSQRHLH
jgi:hypothetical protein